MHPTILVDFGSEFVKAGLVSKDSLSEPSIIVPSSIVKKDNGSVKISPVMSYQTIYLWDDFAKILRYIKKRLLSSENEPCSWIFPYGGPNEEHLERIASVLFDIPGTHSISTPLMSGLPLTALDIKSGVCLDIGSDTTRVSVFHEGVQMSTDTLLFGGRKITETLQRELTESGYYFDKDPYQMEYVRLLKEHCCEIVLDYEEALNESKYSNVWKKEYTLPNGKKIFLNTERFRAAEILFNPDLEFKENYTQYSGEISDPLRNGTCLSALIETSVLRNNLDVREDAFYNIVLCGGTSKLPGLPEKLLRNLRVLTDTPVRVLADPDREKLIWKGAEKAFRCSDSLFFKTRDYFNF